MVEDCIFCSIVNGRTSTEFLYEDDTVVAFNDINPHSPVHILIVPKKHIRSVNDLTDEDEAIIAKTILIGKKMARKAGVSASGYKLVFNVEKGGGQVIFHLHLHLLGGWKSGYQSIQG